MIAWLRGPVLENDGTRLVIEVSGVGYEVQIPASLANLPVNSEDEVGIFVRQTFREDGVTLFGFADRFERKLFDLLTDVKGCGPKTALNVIGELGSEETVHAIANQDTKTICRASGVGPRLAERIFVELKDKAAQEGLRHRISLSQSTAAVRPISKQDELIDALLALGYRRTEAEQAADEARDQADGIEEQLRLALRSLKK